MATKTIDYYNQNAQAFVDATLDVDLTELYDEFLPLIPKNGTLLDAGCGSGRDAFIFKERGFNVDAFDISPEIAKLASEYLNQKVAVSSFKALNDVDKYDGIWCCASLIHVAKNDLTEAFNNLARALKPQGIVYVSFKYGDGEREHNGREFTDLNEQTLESIIKNTNLFTLKSWQSADQRPERASEIWLNAILHRRTI
ncbi:class I SAM-dependent methyltransferase [Pseudoalteromonas sp. N1230-9]|uniref:class I SAM-dependent methyltransferase n=1 Tax=unclassified Pseudoalteromonas TaxID=194690 RepID=UPI0010236A8A|nr:class I SAM-dependent methyltransferase [Pseudoalteromonas sp. CO302Y]RZG06052.1 class I SAM-dependent methyltransferase [Pseudoalteromonas sp. CO133X]WOC28123.1 class I SAM-dependent methyltransferase [Pseudoalteromonas sp. N1230-9]